MSVELKNNSPHNLNLHLRDGGGSIYVLPKESVHIPDAAVSAEILSAEKRGMITLVYSNLETNEPVCEEPEPEPEPEPAEETVLVEVPVDEPTQETEEPPDQEQEQEQERQEEVDEVEPTVSVSPIKTFHSKKRRN